MLHLRQAFGGTPGERRAVARAACDLADSGRYRDDHGANLSPQTVVRELADAPGENQGGHEAGVADRWNWWVGSLELAHGGYAEFQVRAWREGDA